VRRALAQSAENGKPHGGPRPYGWNRDGALDPAEAGIVAELTRRIIGGESVRSLAAELRHRGVPSARGAPWAAITVKSVVIRARNAGLRVHRNEVIGSGTWPAIVSRDEWEAVCALLTDPARNTSPGNTPARLLSGLMSCGVCGMPVRTGGATGGARVYRCSSGSHVKRGVELVDGVVEGYVLALLDREGVGMPGPATGPPDVRGSADAVRLRLAQLEDKYSDGDLTRAGYIRNRDRLTVKLTEFERQEALTRVPGPLEGVTPARWAALPLERRRAVVAHLVDVALLPANGRHNDPELIKITRKGRP
jgi:hypothetical protein